MRIGVQTALHNPTADELDRFATEVIPAMS